MSKKKKCLTGKYIYFSFIFSFIFMTLALINLSISIYNLRNEDFFSYFFLGEFVAVKLLKLYRIEDRIYFMQIF